MQHLAFFAAVTFFLASCKTPNRHFDFSKGQDKLDAYVKIRLSEDESEDIVFYWSGTVFQFIPDQQTQPIFNIEGYTISRSKKTDPGYDQLAREVMVFKDPATGEILKTWYNPAIEDSVEVFHVFNDPVNFQLTLERFESERSLIKFESLGNGRGCMSADVWLCYPSVLTKDEYPENTRSNFYNRGELFSFFYDEKELQNPRLNSTPATFSWSSIGDYLPWMRMADRPGHLVYMARGAKLEGGFNAIPSTLKHYILRSRPEFAEAPDFFSSPNENSWSNWKKEMERRRQN